MVFAHKMETEKLNEIVKILRTAKSILFITGAGISADSGLPTYRGIGGLYNNNSTDDGIPIETALSGQMMATRPEITWKYIHQIEKSCRSAKCNRGHQVIAEMERHFDRVWVLTQNIDGFHHQAGSKNIIDIHGDIHNLHCTRCKYAITVPDYQGLDIPPRCPECSAVVRPEVVLFGEMLPEDKCQLLWQELCKGFDIVFSIGTTSVFPYIAQPVILAKKQCIPSVEINPGKTEVSHLVDHKISDSAAKTLDKIWIMYQNRLDD
jgi:NAD-dependent deacetylase